MQGIQINCILAVIGTLANGDDSNVIASGEITIKEDLGGIVR